MSGHKCRIIKKHENGPYNNEFMKLLKPSSYILISHTTKSWKSNFTTFKDFVGIQTIHIANLTYNDKTNIQPTATHESYSFTLSE
jgi:hypothetical protein